MWYETKGKLIYDPRRPGLKNKVAWWAVLLVDKEITRYYRYWIENNPYAFGLSKVAVYQPSWDAHVSVLRGEKPSEELMHLWKKYHGKEYTIRYNHYPKMTKPNEGNKGDFFFVEVDAPELLAIREELQKPTNWNLHLTVGRTWIYD